MTAAHPPASGGRAPRGSRAARKNTQNNLQYTLGASPRLGVMPAWREPPQHSIYDANTLNHKQRRASLNSTLLKCAAKSANLPARPRSKTAGEGGCWPLAAKQAARVKEAPSSPASPAQARHVAGAARAAAPNAASITAATTAAAAASLTAGKRVVISGLALPAAD